MDQNSKGYSCDGKNNVVIIEGGYSDERWGGITGGMIDFFDKAEILPKNSKETTVHEMKKIAYVLRNEEDMRKVMTHLGWMLSKMH